ncbi:MAG: hypothetical protein KDN22_29730 [Verrucomicrobiae bacterium]|nr:hypothetical protein [Verrucomicrobiae bacterium]
MDYTLITLSVTLILVIAAGGFSVQFWLRRIAGELEKRNELELRFKKMELEAARNGRSHE